VRFNSFCRSDISAAVEVSPQASHWSTSRAAPQFRQRVSKGGLCSFPMLSSAKLHVNSVHTNP
jgi:hypothetical protein